MSWVLVAGRSRGRWPFGALLWCLGGLWREMGGVCAVGSRLVDFWVMHGLVTDERQHVFPGAGVGELLRVCQQEVFAVYHLGRCPADCF